MPEENGKVVQQAVQQETKPEVSAEEYKKMAARLAELEKKEKNRTRSVYEVLSEIDCSDKVETKGDKVKLTYLSWAWAWGILLKNYPDATYTVYERKYTKRTAEIEEEGSYNFFTDGFTCWVKVGVTVNGVERIEQLPVMDNHHVSIPYNSITSFDVNTAIQRCLVKAIARHGLGLYIYAGEDLPDGVETKVEEEKKEEKAAPVKETKKVEKTLKPAAAAAKPTTNVEDVDSLSLVALKNRIGNKVASLQKAGKLEAYKNVLVAVCGEGTIFSVKTATEADIETVRKVLKELNKVEV